jgi:hypothetical protein
MKTSSKIMIAVAFLLVALWVTTLFLVRKDIRTILAEQSRVEYRSLPVEKFSSLDFSGSWIVTVRQGKDCKVEVGSAGTGPAEPELNHQKGTLHLSSETEVYARITAPDLQVIKAGGDTRIDMKNFWTDSITVILVDSSSFTGRQNDFKYISFKAYGNP